MTTPVKMVFGSEKMVVEDVMGMPVEMIVAIGFVFLFIMIMLMLTPGIDILLEKVGSIFLGWPS